MEEGGSPTGQDEVVLGETELLGTLIVTVVTQIYLLCVKSHRTARVCARTQTHNRINFTEC